MGKSETTILKGKILKFDPYHSATTLKLRG